ncbi:MAG: PorP/SprF family type IX secretion system membrane protein [Chitinophagales bacterium]
MKKLYTIVLLNLLVVGVFAQDVHFSQVFNAPLWLNPALTGFTPGVARVGATYRNQWASATGSNGFFKAPFMTTALAADMPIKINNDAIGVGLFLANDQQGAGTFNGVIAMASVSYIKALGKKSNHRLSAGFQAGYTFQSIKTQDFQFANQFQDNQFVSTMPNNELIGRNSVGYLNLNAGMFWYSKLTDIIGMYAGASVYNVTLPKYDILENQNKRLYWRWNVHSGLDITINKKMHILPSGMFTRQGVNDQLNVGLGFGYDFKDNRGDDNSSVTFGIYNRIHNMTTGVTTDAIIPYAGFVIAGFKIGVSYDATISKLKSAGSGVGALELHLGYTIKRKDYSYYRSVVCPRF